MQFDTRIAFGPVAQDFAGTIRGGVIENHKLKITESLFENAFNACIEKWQRVVYRHHNAKQGILLLGHRRCKSLASLAPAWLIPDEPIQSRAAEVGDVLNHDASLHAARINWLSSGPNTYYQANWATAGNGTDVHDFQNLDFRVSRRLNFVDNNPAGRTTFSFQLVLANGLSNAVSLCKYIDLRGPVGGIACIPQPGLACVNKTNLHELLQTVRIPLGDFGAVDLTKVRGVRFSFNNTSSGSINLANIRFTRGQ